MKDFIKRVKYFISPCEYYVFGDSHTAIFHHLNNLQGKKIFHVTRVDGATALGMVNPNSKTNALPAFMKIISLLPKKSKLIFLLGEVDAGFLLWHRSQQFSTNVHAEVNKSIENYLLFLKKLQTAGFSDIIVLSPSPPCVLDEFKEKQKIELRRNIAAGINERTHLAIEYNNLLKNKVEHAKIVFVDLYDSLIDENTGIIKSKYLNNDRTEHHLDSSAFGNLIFERLKRNKVK